MYVTIYEHLTPKHVLEVNECPRRICVALHEKDGTFIDSFDYKTVTNQIRFYGDSKHYNWADVPTHKQKLWKTKDFKKLLFHSVDVGRLH